ncbi:MAG: cupin domain-containing protein [Candidatus Eremiobacteraeota bacterium]|nr:cupin domain-containing protein [Candidatus Eremiobacteraeota bacterium]
MQAVSGRHFKVAEALTRGPDPGNLAAAIARFGDVELEFYAPKDIDPQHPHTRDELYIIARGSGVLTVADEDLKFVEGDVLFVPAHAGHRFSEFSDDFATWVIFYGPEGGAR